MTLTRRRFLGATALLGLAGCAAPAAPAAPAPVGPVDSPEALADWITAHRDQVSVLFDDGRGDTFAHLADTPRPIASAVKVVPLVAYAQAVAAGRLDPAGPVPVAEWERWYVPGADGGAHPAALQSLGVTSEGAVTWDDIAAVMIDFSDNAAADLLGETLGADALVAAAAAGGWTGFDVPYIAGEDLYVVSPTPPADRRPAARDLGRAYAAGDPAARELAAVYTAGAPGGGGAPGPARAAASGGAASGPVRAAAVGAGAPDPTWDAAVSAWDGSWAATVTQLGAVHRAAAAGALGPDVSATVQRHLERALAGRLPAGVLGFGQKGGSLPGVLSLACSMRRDDGTVGVSVLSLSRLPQDVYAAASGSTALLLAQQALVDDGLRDRLRTAVAG